MKLAGQNVEKQITTSANVAGMHAHELEYLHTYTRTYILACLCTQILTGLPNKVTSHLCAYKLTHL